MACSAPPESSLGDEKRAGATSPGPTADDADLEALARAIVARVAARAPWPEPQRHAVADRDTWPWLPTQEHTHLAPHPFCKDCGGVKYVGSTRALPMGGLTNLASRLARDLGAQGRKVTEAQIRLIMKRLHEAGASDGFVHSRATQERLLLETFRSYTGLDEGVLVSFLRNMHS